jgi:hypothetical protein
MLSKSHTRKGIGRPGYYGPENAVRISLFRGEARRGLQANHQRITNRAYVMKNQLVFRQTSKETVEVLARRGTPSGQGRRRVVLGWLGKPRTSSLVVDQGINSMEVEGEEKMGKRSRLICLYDGWIDGNSIGHDPLIYIEGVVLSQ